LEEAWRSVPAFCVARGLVESTFFAKRHKLGRSDRSSNSPVSSIPIPSFAAVRLNPDPTIEIVIPGGLILRVPAGAGTDIVARLVVALRGVPC
jgi:hypothetical protein